jgi:FKBP-type peptidyl-prolyl cis-trans isomerase FklB
MQRTLSIAMTLLFLAAPAVAQNAPAGRAAAPRQSIRKAAPPRAGGQPAAETAAAPAGNSGLRDQKEKVSYSLGLDIGRTLKMQAIDVDMNIIMQGCQDGLTGAQPLLTDEQIQEVMQTLQQEIMAREQQKMQAASGQNEDEGSKFLEANKKAKGVVTLPSGLQYKVVKMGSGPKPKATDTVKTHYKGTLISGTEFDSSYKRGEPAVFPVNQVIPGWTEALQLMPVGSKWELYVPAKLAYGERGAGQEIGPNSTLIFEVELLGIEAPQ